MMGRGADGDADDDTYVRSGAAREGPGVGGGGVEEEGIEWGGEWLDERRW